ncbi:DUF6141 family protein [Peribacillus butanolivorans]|uniref:DUF6141 family protein n=1 Tax=Peribacillus butanolivorans TaxID=421767 RepID=UPI0036DAD206
MSKDNDSVLYREVQRPRQLLYIIVIILVSGFFWWGVIQQVIYGIQFGDKPMSDIGLVISWVLFGLIIPLLAFQVKMITEVRGDGLYIKFVPFHFGYRDFRYQSIRDYKSVSLSSLKRFGGWGIRINLNGERLYNIAGSEGVELRLASGDIVIIGSKNSDELKKALDLSFIDNTK